MEECARADDLRTTSSTSSSPAAAAAAVPFFQSHLLCDNRAVRCNTHQLQHFTWRLITCDDHAFWSVDAASMEGIHGVDVSWLHHPQKSPKGQSASPARHPVHRADPHMRLQPPPTPARPRLLPPRRRTPPHHPASSRTATTRRHHAVRCSKPPPMAPAPRTFPAPLRLPRRWNP